MGEHDRVNILVVDDQPAKLLSYEAVLRDLDEHLIKASSAREALELLLKNEIAVILVDVCMPELDGFQLATIIREHPRFSNTAIVFISAVQMDDFDRLRGYKLGAVDYVPVPIIPELLRAKVKVFAELYRKTRQLEQLNRNLEQMVSDRTAELVAANAKMQTAIDVARLGTWDWDLQSGEINWSDRCFKLFGYEPGEVKPSIEAWSAHLHPDDDRNVLPEFASSPGSTTPYHQIFRCAQPDSSVVWCEARAHKEYDSSGRPRQLTGVIADITEQKLAEERQQLMLQELHHRVKNSLSTIQAIASLTARTSPDVKMFYTALSSRIQSLSRTHTVLVSRNWQRIDFRDLLAAELESFALGNDERFSCSGPSIGLPSELALALGMVVHELSTNAAKYGALSVPRGTIGVSWKILSNGNDNRTLQLRWIERGGPVVKPPERQGFGSTLLQQLFANQTGAEAHLKFGETGVEFCATVPLRG